MTTTNPAEDLHRPHVWIDSEPAMAAMLEQLEPAQWLAVDTEFNRTDTFYPQAGLFQIYDGERVYLIDAPLIQDWKGLGELFTDQTRVKVFHACGEDLELFFSLGIPQPQPLYDTQIAAAMLGGDLNEGLQSLARNLLSVELPKHETRSDWLARPLSDEQIRYAKEDVVVLEAVFAEQKRRLDPLDRYDLVLSEGRRLTENAAKPLSDHDYYQKMRGAWKMPVEAQMLLCRLAEWREQTARNADKPRKRVCSDDDLMQIALKKPQNMGALTRQTELRGGQLRRFGADILKVVEEFSGEQINPQEFVMIRPPLPKDCKEIYQSTRELARNVAERECIHPALLASRSMLEELVHWVLAGRPPGKPTLLESWRAGMVGHALLEHLADNTGSLSEN